MTPVQINTKMKSKGAHHDTERETLKCLTVAIYTEWDTLLSVFCVTTFNMNPYSVSQLLFDTSYGTESMVSLSQWAPIS